MKICYLFPSHIFKTRQTILNGPLAGKTLILEAEPSDEPIKLKAIIEERENIPVERLRLLWAGKVLDDNITLFENGIKEGGATLSLVTHLPQRYIHVFFKIVFAKSVVVEFFKILTDSYRQDYRSRFQA